MARTLVLHDGGAFCNAALFDAKGGSRAGRVAASWASREAAGAVSQVTLTGSSVATFYRSLVLGAAGDVEGSLGWRRFSGFLLPSS